MRGRPRGLRFGLPSKAKGLGIEPPKRRKGGKVPRFKRRGDDPAERCTAFVEEARTRPAWLRELRFEDDCWDVTGLVPSSPGSPALGSQRLYFGTGPKVCSLPELSLLIRPFAKAVVRQTTGVRLGLLNERIQGCRFMGEALDAAGLMAVSDCTPAVLDDACKRAQARYGAGSGKIEAQLRLIARFLGANDMTVVPVGDWTPTHAALPPSTNAGGRAVRAAALLPADCYVDDLAAAAAAAKDPGDVALTSLLTIHLLTLGPRIGTVLDLEEDCDDGLDDGVSLALRWSGSKGRGPEVIDVPAPFAAVVREALRRAREATAAGRAIKRWYDAHPKEIYLPPGVGDLRGHEWLSFEEAESLVGASTDPTAIYHRMKGLGVEVHGRRRGRTEFVRFADLERVIVARSLLPMRIARGSDFHPLFVIEEGTFTRTSSVPCPTLFQKVTHQVLGAGMRSGLWRRTGVDRDGARDRTHSVRHFWATLGMAFGIPEDDVAEVQRRSNVEQNRHYQHAPEPVGSPLLAATAKVLAAGGDLSAAGSMPDADVLKRRAAAILRSQGIEPEGGTIYGA